MGIKELWDILEPVKQEIILTEFRGIKLAVDFSAWLVECGTTQHTNRSLFYRILDLMSNGITPVFVIDSAKAPNVKFRKRGEQFSKLNSQWAELIEAMGFTVVRATGEAEKTCAHLNSSKIVDGCVTNDGDAFAYGATTVFKDYKVKSAKIHMYEMSKVIKELGLGQKEMIAAAILIGCGYCSGVSHVGKTKFLELEAELKRNGVSDILERMRSWKDNNDLISIDEDKRMLKESKKGTHCSRCSHTGSISKHNKDGCLQCGMDKLCKECADDVVPCSCEFHSLETRIKPFLTELKVRESSLSLSNFPDEEVISEFLSQDKRVFDDIDITVEKPNWPQAIELLTDKFGLGPEVTNHFFPALVKMCLYGKVKGIEITPLEVLKKCKRGGKPCYLVRFREFDDDITRSTEDEKKHGYEIIVLQSVFDSKFPHLSPKEDKQPENEQGQSQTPPKSSKGRKRGKEVDTKQRKLTDMFPIKKKPSIDVKNLFGDGDD